MKKTLEYLAGLHLLLNDFPITEIDRAVKILDIARRKERNIFIIGNGGSASTASHMVCDLAKNTRTDNLPNMRVFDLTSQPTITAYANDNGYENIFVNQLNGLAKTYDVLIAISASGNSQNIINAVDYANKNILHTISLTGFDGGLLKKITDVNIHIQSNCIEQVEDCHLIINHIFTQRQKHWHLKK